MKCTANDENRFCGLIPLRVWERISENVFFVKRVDALFGTMWGGVVI